MWQTKAHRIIGELSRESWRKANMLPNGKLRKRHVPYSIPDVAQRLIECLDRNDEIGAKVIFNLLAFSPEAAND